MSVRGVGQEKIPKYNIKFRGETMVEASRRLTGGRHPYLVRRRIFKFGYSIVEAFTLLPGEQRP